MRELDNVLYVTTQNSHLRLERDALRVHHDHELKARFPLMELSGIVLFGNITITPALIRRCAQDGRSIVWLTTHGRYLGSLQGPTHGNVLLRIAQYETLGDVTRTLLIARQFVAAKIKNSRTLVMRASRDTNGSRRDAIVDCANRLADLHRAVAATVDLNQLRGVEGAAAKTYFAAIRLLISPNATIHAPAIRTRRPPTDPFNALISLLYTLNRTECEAALEGVGLDPQAGYLHALRPGRPALALDLQEPLRPVMDRLALTLINRRQLDNGDFVQSPGGAVHLTNEGRRTVLIAYQKRKETPHPHRILKQDVPLGLIPHVQARLLARHLRGDLATYPPYLTK